jgi:hypothetical protein
MPTLRYKRDSEGKFVKGTPQPFGFGKGKQEIPWNKGLNIQCNTGRTHFKKGDKPWCDGLNKDTDKRLKKLSENRMGEGNPRYIRGYFISNGYKILNLNGTQIEEHRYIWEQHNGKIPKGKFIHHINGNRMDNRIENLQCVTNSEHTKIHHKMRSK